MTTETVSQFLERVERIHKQYPEWRYGQSVWNAMGRSLGANDPYHNDNNVEAFLADAVKAGVLVDEDRQGMAVWHASQVRSPWVWMSPYLLVGDGLDIGRVEESGGKWRARIRIGDAVLTSEPLDKLEQAQQRLADVAKKEGR